MFELGMPKLEKYAKSNPLLKERYPIPPKEEENKIIRIALFVSESVMDVFFECEEIRAFIENIIQLSY